MNRHDYFHLSIFLGHSVHIFRPILISLLPQRCPWLSASSCWSALPSWSASPRCLSWPGRSPHVPILPLPIPSCPGQRRQYRDSCSNRRFLLDTLLLFFLHGSRGFARIYILRYRYTNIIVKGRIVLSNMSVLLKKERRIINDL